MKRLSAHYAEMTAFTFGELHAEVQNNATMQDPIILSTLFFDGEQYCAGVIDNASACCYCLQHEIP